MSDQREISAHPQPPQCPKCKLPPRFMTSILDVKQNRSVFIYRCDPCGEEVWR